MFKKRERELFDKARHFEKLGNYKEAIKCYDTILELNEGNADAWNDKGAALDDLGQAKEAIKCYTRALEINPTHPEALCNKEDALSDISDKQLQELKNLIQETRQLDKAKEKIQNWKDEGYDVSDLEKVIKKSNEEGFDG